ncbi:alpha-ketoglutarate-dependent dioxygenase alkB homolog 4 [Onthophagus taurus]|uniref:alpha-ketoglutarate-dependent dioxygenase alkB homolog 4 n=1 Tax=Onthophagus taurus TaxID=166361 RepID=UPI0039BE6477
METCRSCGCKGIRTCLLCETEYKIQKDTDLNLENGSYVYCPFCNKSFEGWECFDYEEHPNHGGKKSYEFPGIYIKLDFLSQSEEEALLNGIDNIPWVHSQSGRRKQNYGPKCNFKKKKIQLGDFKGFPKFSEFVQEKFKQIKILNNFKTIEQCSLEYNPQRGASIDPHIDDCWVWGERIVSVNLAADSVLTMTFNSKLQRYNLEDVSTYPSVLLENGDYNKNYDSFKIIQQQKFDSYPVIRVPMPRRSLLVMFGSARYEWEHRILREDIKSTRVCLAYREFTPPFLPGGDKFEKGETILNTACNFIN